MASSDEKVEAAKKICEKLKIPLAEFFSLLEEYNEKIDEINERTVTHMRAFILPKAKNINGILYYELNADDKAILQGYKEKGEKELEEAFPQFKEISEYLESFRENISINRYL